HAVERKREKRHLFCDTSEAAGNDVDVCSSSGGADDLLRESRRRRNDPPPHRWGGSGEALCSPIAQSPGASAAAADAADALAAVPRLRRENDEEASPTRLS